MNARPSAHSIGRRALLGAGAAGASALGLAACGGGSGDGGGAGGGGTKPVTANLEERGPITLATGKDTTGKLKEFLERWNKDHPDEKVTLVELPESADEQRAQMINNAQAKSDAYTVLGLDVVWTAEFAANQWVTELPEDKFKLDGLIGATVDTGRYFKKLYSVPFTTNAQLLYSRKDLLEEAGHSEPPKTFEEMYQVIGEIKRKHPEMKGFGSQYSKYEGLTCQITGVVKSAGGELFDDKGTPHADSAEAVKGLEAIRDGFDKGFIPKEALTYKEEESRQAFQDGTLVFLQNWPYVYALSQAEDGSSKVKGKVLVSVVPGTSGDGASTLGGLNYAVSAFGKNQGTAVDFIAFMAEEAQQKEWMIATGNAPALAAVYEDAEVKKAYPFIDILKKGVEGGVARPQVVKYGDVTQAIQDAAYGCISGETEAEAAMKDLQEKLSSLADK